MKINFILPPVNMSGGMRVISIYARILQERGHSVVIVSQPNRRMDFKSYIKACVNRRKIFWPKYRRNSPSHFDAINLDHRIVDHQRPIQNNDVPDGDVVLATFWRTGPWVMNLAPSKGAKVIFLQGYETSPGREDYEIDSVWQLPLKKIVISSWMVDYAFDRFGDGDVCLIPNSVDSCQFAAPERYKQSKPTVGFLYSTLHLKGVDITLKALEKVRCLFPQLRVLAFGSSPLKSELMLPDGVEYYCEPSQVEIPKLYAQCDVWMCGSRREGFHLPPLEAMACRCPVVSTRIGGPLDVILDGKNGYLVDVEDHGSLADRVIDILSLSDQNWRCMSDAALSTASKYTWSDAVDKFEDFLKEKLKEI